MLRIVSNPTFTHAVIARVPIDGGHREENFRATFRVLPSDELAQHDLDTAEGAAACLRAMIVRLDDLADADGRPVLYSDEVRDQVIRLPYVSRALFDAYRLGVAGARTGN